MDPVIDNPLSPLTPYQSGRLEKFGRLLANVVDPAIAAQVRQRGYDDEEHRRAWTLYTTATGMDRPLSHFLSTARQQTTLADRPAIAARFRTLDLFENKWVPRTRNTIRRFIHPDHRQTYEQAFFDGLSQQPEGPLVVGSVDLLVKRLQTLKEDTTPGASDAWRALQKKGLTDDELARIQGVLEEAKATPEGEVPAPEVSQEELQQAAQAQLAAYEELNLLYIDWAEVFRQELPHGMLVKLGLVSVGGGRKGGGEEPGSEA